MLDPRKLIKKTGCRFWLKSAAFHGHNKLNSSGSQQECGSALGGHPCDIFSLQRELGILDHKDGELDIHDFIGILQKCRKKKDLSCSKQVHGYIRHIGLEDHNIIGNYLVPMLVDCGSLLDAQNVFEKLAYRNVYCWTSLISGYIQSGQPEQAFTLFRNMQEDKVDPSSHTYLALIKGCRRLQEVQEIYCDIVQKGFENDIFISSCLVDIYIKCKSLSEAQKVFDEMAVRNVVSWNTLITGYAEQGHEKDVLMCFELMQLEDVCPDNITFVCILKACGSNGATERGRKVHTNIVLRGYDVDLSVGNTLVDMYANFGFILDAQVIFDSMQAPSVVSWNALIGGYTDHGRSEEAINLFHKMQRDGISGTSVTFICVLKACGNFAALDTGRKIHMQIIQEGWDKDLFINSSIIDMYAKCLSLDEARAILHLGDQSTVAWNTIIAGYAEYGPDQEALNCFEQMALQMVSPNEITLACVLKSCASLRALDKGRELHTKAVMKGFERDLIVGSTLIDMYVKCESLIDGQGVSDKLPSHNVVTLTALLGGYVEHGLCHEALNFYGKIQMQGVSPNAPMLATVSKACGSVGHIEMCWEVHGDILLKGLERDLTVGNTIVDMYAKCGFFADAWDVFNKWPARDIVMWNSLIAGYAENEQTCEDALETFQRLQQHNVSPNDITLSCVLKVCSTLSLVEKGQEIHMLSALQGLERDLMVGSSLVDMYASCGPMAEAQYSFDKMPVCSVVTWTSLISGYVEHGQGEEALRCFEQIHLRKFSSNASIFASVTKACGSIGSLELGQNIHTEITLKGLEQDLYVGNSLLDMYTKRGSLTEAEDTFKRLPIRDVVSWNAMIKGYGMNQDGNKAVQVYEEMKTHMVKPNAITFSCLLNACSHASLVFKGQELFKEMGEEYGIIPTADHFASMIDLYARSGQLHEAGKFLDSMPFSPSRDTLTLLLSACKTHVEPGLGFRCFQQLLHVDAEFSAPYILMANLYGSAGMWDEALWIEKQRQSQGAQKKPGSVFIEVNNTLHEFVVGRELESEDLSTMLKTLTSRIETMGHIPNLDLVMRPASMSLCD